MTQNYVCIHGHFYQPPRENPWLDAVELQESASPYQGWNERVIAECYLPRAARNHIEEETAIDETLQALHALDHTDSTLVLQLPCALRTSSVSMSTAVSGNHMPSGPGPLAIALHPQQVS